MAYSFECRLCRNNKQGYEKRKIIMIDTPNDRITEGNVCSQCFYKLGMILASDKISVQMKQQSLDIWKLKIET